MSTPMFHAGDKVRLVSTNFATTQAGLSPAQVYTVARGAATAYDNVLLVGQPDVWPVHLFELAPEGWGHVESIKDVDTSGAVWGEESRAGTEGLKGLEAELVREVAEDSALVTVMRVPDPINHPAHYSRWTMEPIEFIAVNDLPWWVANVVKYCMRFDAKDGLADMYKARSYLDMKIRQLEGVPEFWKQPVAIERALNA